MIKDNEVRVIENTRHILNYDKMMNEMKNKELTPTMFAVASFPWFFEAAKALCIPSLEQFPETILQEHYRNYIIKVSMLAEEQSED